MWRLTDYPAERIEADIIVAGIYSRREMDESSMHLARRMGGFALNRIEDAKLEPGEVMLVTTPRGWEVPWTLWVGMGDAHALSLEHLGHLLERVTETIGGIGAETPCFTLLGEGASSGLELTGIAETITSQVPFKNSEIFHPRREVLYRLFASLPNRFYYRLWSGEERKGA